jgi:hypothetical protein
MLPLGSHSAAAKKVWQREKRKGKQMKGGGGTLPHRRTAMEAAAIVPLRW